MMKLDVQFDDNMMKLDVQFDHNEVKENRTLGCNLFYIFKLYKTFVIYKN